MSNVFVTYFRLSKGRIDDLGIDAQRTAVSNYLKQVNGIVIAEYLEIESGKKNDRPQLLAAIEMCRKNKGARLCIAKLDRLARNCGFLMSLRDSGVNFVAADMPFADTLSIGIASLFAQAEREKIAERTRLALCEAKKRGVRLGCPDAKRASALGSKANCERAARYAANVLPIIHEIQAAGVTSMRGIAAALNARGIRSPLNKTFSRQTVSNLITRSLRSHRAAA